MSDQCDPEVYKDGIQVFLTNTIRARDVEMWVQKIAADSGQKVDWHYCGGRAVVLAIGNLEKVKEAILKNKDMHDDFYTKESEVYMPGYNHQRCIDGIWQYNGF